MPTTVQQTSEQDHGGEPGGTDAVTNSSAQGFTDSPEGSGASKGIKTLPAGQRSRKGKDGPEDGWTPALPRQLKLGLSESTRGTPDDRSTRTMRSRDASSRGSRTAKTRLLRKVRGRMGKPNSLPRLREDDGSDDGPGEEGEEEKGRNTLMDFEEGSGEAEMIARLVGERGDSGLEEEPLDVALWTLSIREIKPDLGDEEENFARTIQRVKAWKEETMRKEFDRVRKAVAQGGEELRRAAADVTKKLLRAHKLKVCVASGILIELMREKGGAHERLVLDFMQGFVTQCAEDFEEYVQEAQCGSVDAQWLTDEPFQGLEGFEALDGRRWRMDKNGVDNAWSWAAAGVVNLLCGGRRGTETKREILRVWSAVNENGELKASSLLIQQEGQSISLWMAAHREALRVCRLHPGRIGKGRYAPDDEEVAANLMATTLPYVKKFVMNKLRKQQVDPAEVDMMRRSIRGRTRRARRSKRGR